MKLKKWWEYYAPTGRWHGDHFGYAKQLREYRIPIYAPASCEGEVVIPLAPKHRYRIGGFSVMPLKVPHGDCECFAYVIDHPETGRILFATDLEDFPYKIRDINTLMIEANYSKDIMVERMLDNEEIRSRSENHMEIETTLNVVERLCSPTLKRVVLLHLSSQLSDVKGFRESVNDVCALAEVYVAGPGAKYNVDKEMF